MSLPYVITPAGRKDIDDSFDFYEQRQPGVGVRFLQAVRDAIQDTAANPQRYPPVHGQIREAPVSGFPFCVYYRLRSPGVRVVSVLHNSRDPSVWQGRR